MVKESYIRRKSCCMVMGVIVPKAFGLPANVCQGAKAPRKETTSLLCHLLLAYCGFCKDTTINYNITIMYILPILWSRYIQQTEHSSILKSYLICTSVLIYKCCLPCLRAQSSVADINNAASNSQAPADVEVIPILGWFIDGLKCDTTAATIKA